MERPEPEADEPAFGTTTRRRVLQLGASTFLAGGVAGCSFIGGTSRGVSSVYVENETSTEKTVTVRFEDCSISTEEEKTVTVNANDQEKLNNVAVWNSGACTLEVSVQGGNSETHAWDVKRDTLHVSITNDDITFSVE